MEEQSTLSIEKQLDQILAAVRLADHRVRKAHLENEQFFLDWQDNLNAISVK